MASELYVETLKGLTSGANANKVTVGSGQTLYAPGHVIQVLSTTKNDTFAMSGQTDAYVDISGFNVSITPSSANSKILVTGYVAGGVSVASSISYRLMRDSTAIAISNSGQTIRSDHEAFGTPARGWHHAPFSFLDSPATTSAVTYKLQMLDSAFSSSTIYVNRNGDSGSISVSTITVMEIAG